MLTLTENASAVIKNITESQQQPDGAGLRIVQQGDGQEAELALTTATEPESGGVQFTLAIQPGGTSG